MKTRIFKSLLALMLTFVALPMMAQDCMEVHFKDGTTRKFYLKNVTEITTSRQDADGVMHSNYDYQHVTTTTNGKCVYALNDIDSISFTKFYEEKARENFDSSMKAVLQVLSESNTIQDIENHLSFLKNTKGIDDAWIAGNDLYIKVANFETMSFHNCHNLNSYSGKSNMRNLDRLKVYVNKVSLNTNKSQLKAVLINQTELDERPSVPEARERLHNLENKFKECGVETFYNDYPTIDFFYSELFDYDIIVLLAHGGYDNENKVHRFATAEELGKIREYKVGVVSDAIYTFSDYYEKISELREKYGATDNEIVISWIEEKRDDKTYRVAYPSIKESFFALSSNNGFMVSNARFKNPYSMLFSLSCHSLEGDDIVDSYGNKYSRSFADKFFEKGLGLYIGYDKEVLFDTASPASTYFFEGLLKGYNLFSVLQNMPYDYVIGENGARIHALKGPCIEEFNLFLFSSTTIKADQNFINQEYASNKTVTIEGYKTHLEDTDIEAGFEVGETSNLSPEFGIHESVVQERVGSNVPGDYIFRLTLSNLKPGKTYYYRAYTYDGLHYNYGETYSFTIDKVQDLSIAIAGNIDLEVGASANVRIMSGSGDYTLSSDKPNVAKPSLAGEFITVEALSAGKATITVTDNITKQTASFTVTVTASTPAEETLLETTVEGVGYRIYKRSIDKNNVRLNADGHEFYKTQMALDVTKNGQKQTYVVDNAIYLDVPEKHHEGQYPCAMFDLGKKQLTVFCNSKGEDEYYGMDGNLYTTSLDNIKFTKETVFTGANFGWYPFFKRFDTGETGLVHFSFAGYFNIWSERGDDGEWKLYYYQEYISPEDAKEQGLQEGNVLVILGGSQAYTSCPDGNHPHMIDMGLPSGTKWACCNVGADNPHDYGNYYAWGETEVKDQYSCYNYTLLCKSGSFDCYRNIGSDIAGTDYDVAHVKWGGNWVMPNFDQIKELYQNCSSELTTLSGVAGMLFKSNNGASLFIPAAGNYSYSLLHTNYYGYCWSSTSGGNNSAYSLFFSTNNNVSWRDPDRCGGHSVRPVRMNSSNSKRKAIANKRYSWKGKQLENNH